MLAGLGAIALSAPVALAALLRPGPTQCADDLGSGLWMTLVATSLGSWLADSDATGRLSLSMLGIPLVLLGIRESTRIRRLRGELALLHLTLGMVGLLFLIAQRTAYAFVSPADGPSLLSALPIVFPCSPWAPAVSQGLRRRVAASWARRSS